MKADKSSNELGGHDWTAIEKAPSQEQAKIGDGFRKSVLKGIFKGDTCTKVLGKVYAQLDSKKTQKKQKLTVEEIKMNNFLKKFEEKQNSLQQNPFKIDTTYVELIGMHLIKISQILIDKINKINSKEAVELAIGMDMFVSQMQQYKGPSVLDSTSYVYVSEKLLEEVKSCKKKIVKFFNINYSEIPNLHCELIYKNKYYKYIPSLGFKFTSNQEKLLEAFADNINNPFLFQELSTVGSGKTYSLLALALFLFKHRTETKSKKVILFACESLHVRVLIATLCRQNGIEFASAKLKVDDTIKISNQKSSTDETRVVIICRPETATKILEDEYSRMEKQKDNECRYILVFDEITMGIDHCQQNLIQNAELLSKLPPQTILMSATMPNLHKIGSFMEEHFKKYPQCVTKCIKSDDIYIPCSVRAFDGSTILPHLGATNKGDICNTVSSIKSTSFIRRMITPPDVMNLFKKMKKKRVEHLPDIEEKFFSVENFTGKKVAELYIELLEILSKEDDKIIKAICKKPDSEECEKIELEEFAKQFNEAGNILLVSESPLNEVSRFSNLIKEVTEYVKENNFNTLSDMVSQYLEDLDTYIQQKNKLESNISSKTLENMGNSSFEMNKKNHGPQGSSSHLAVIGSLKKLQEPEFKYPAKFQIGTPDYCNSNGIKLEQNKYRISYNISSLPLKNLNIPEEVLILLFSGIGFLTRKFGSTYFNLIANLASEGNLAILIADRDICYGANFCIDTVIIELENYSVQTLFQIMGRAGRRGKAFRIANAFIPMDKGLKLLEFISGKINCFEKSEEEMLSQVLDNLM